MYADTNVPYRFDACRRLATTVFLSAIGMDMICILGMTSGLIQTWREFVCTSDACLVASFHFIECNDRQ